MKRAINTDLCPSTNKDYMYLHEENEEIMAKYSLGNETGKWMMFWQRGNELKEKWIQARKLYNEGKLTGIHSMKVRTLCFAENPLVVEENVKFAKELLGIEGDDPLDYKDPKVLEAYEEVILMGRDPKKYLKKDGTLKFDVMAPIIFYCGPASNETLMLEFGNCLLQHIPYHSINGHMYFKTDAQTGIGTRASGQLNNHTYKIAVPRPPSSSKKQ